MLHNPNYMVWDVCFTREEETHYALYVEGNEDTGKATIALSESVDLFNWTRLGSVFSASQDDWDNKSISPGSLIQDTAGTWHLFYTGTSRDTPHTHHIGHATSKTLTSWTRTATRPFFSQPSLNSAYYEQDDRKQSSFGHPHVFKNPTGPGWLMVFSARSSGVESQNAGCIGLAISPDLYTWTLEKPIFIGGFSQIDHPQVFFSHNHWHALFSAPEEAWTQKTAQIYNMAPATGMHILDGWTIPTQWRLSRAGFLGSHVVDGKAICLADRSFIIGNYNGDNPNHFGKLTHPYRLGKSQVGLILQQQFN